MSQVITIDDLQAYSPDTLDAGRAQIFVDAVNSWVQTRTNRCFGETTEVTERYDWGKNPIWLRHQDVTGISLITIGYPGQEQTTLDSASYIVNSLGRVTLLGLGRGRFHAFLYYNEYVEITYTYGVTAVPDDLKMAVLGIAAGFYSWATNGGRDVSAVSVGTYQIEYTNKRVNAGSAPDVATSTADLNFSMIDAYRQRRM